jgi:hypothetical protein
MAFLAEARGWLRFEPAELEALAAELRAAVRGAPDQQR